jgi:hypothetical protein
MVAVLSLGLGLNLNMNLNLRRSGRGPSGKHRDVWAAQLGGP